MSGPGLVAHAIITAFAMFGVTLAGVVGGEIVYEHCGRSACCIAGGCVGCVGTFAVGAWDFLRRQRKANS